MRISIITVVRNDSEGLTRTIASIRDQLSGDFEFIVVDGASTDGTIDVIRQNADLVDDWESREDNGIYDAMNKGLRRATGHLVLFLNAGDEFLNRDSLTTVIRGAEKYPEADVLHFRALGKDMQPVGRFVRPAAILFDSVGNHQAVLIRTEVHKRFLFDTSYRIKADRDVQLRMHLSGCNSRSIPECITRFEGGGVSSSAIPAKEWENVRICWDNRVGFRWTLIASSLAAARLTLFGLTRLSGLDWAKTKARLRPKTLGKRLKTTSRNLVASLSGSVTRTQVLGKSRSPLNAGRITN